MTDDPTIEERRKSRRFILPPFYEGSLAVRPGNEREMQCPFRVNHVALACLRHVCLSPKSGRAVISVQSSRPGLFSSVPSCSSLRAWHFGPGRGSLPIALWQPLQNARKYLALPRRLFLSIGEFHAHQHPDDP